MKRWEVLTRVFALPLLIIVLMSTFVGCSKSTAPGADMAGGVFEESSFTFMKWKEGLTLMIWYEALASSNSHGSSSTESSVYKLEGYTESEDGIRIEWNLETSDGKTAEFAIDNTSYDLSEGSLFIIGTTIETPTVMQLNHDLSGIQPVYESCVAFGKSDPDVVSFIESISSEQ
ncbi:MAG: hypothetical protein HQ553_15695 [Chloroflexi bacterium]|nr:hypothetical protein [Chloroflexota bacterium]